MLETDATTARNGAGAAIHGDLSPRETKGAEADVASVQQHATAEPGPQQASHNETAATSEAGAPDVSSSDRAARQGSEIELKLLVDADRLADFNAARVIVVNARNKGTRKHLRSAYFDTPERTLRRNGLSLRVRQNGTRFVQTVKTDCADDPLRRGEWEASVASMAPDLALAILCAFVEVRLASARSRTSVPDAPYDAHPSPKNASYEPLCCDNFA